MRLRRGLAIAAAALAVLTIAGVLAAHWASRSETVLRWAIAQLGARLPGTLTVDGLRGALDRPIRIETLAYVSGSTRVHARGVELDWSPAALLAARRVQVDRLAIDQLAIDTVPDDTPATLPPHLRLPLPVRVDELSIARLQVDNGATPVELTGLALSYAVGKAVWRGIFTSNLPFHRTPKMENAPAALRGIVTAWEETLVFLALIGCGLLTLHERWIERDAQLWAVLCFVQALPFGAALVLSMINALRLGRRRLPKQPSLQAAIALADGRTPNSPGPNAPGPNSPEPDKPGGGETPSPQREAA